MSTGVRAAVAAYVIWGLLTIYWKQLERFHPLELIGWRISMAAVVMAVVISIRSRWPIVLGALRSTRLLPRLVLAGTLLTVNWTMYVWAVVSEQIVETALGYFLAPLGTMAIGVFVLGERLTPLKWAAIGFAGVAVAVLTVSYGRVPWIAIVIAATWSLYGLTKRRVPLTPIESLAGEVFVLVGPALAVVMWGATRAGGAPDVADATSWALLLGTGAITAVPLLLFSIAARSVPFTLLGPLNYLVPIINLLLGWLVYGEPMPVVRFVGFALVWFALVAVTADTIRAGRRARIQALVTT